MIEYSKITVDESSKWFDPRVAVVVEEGVTSWGERYPSVIMIGYAHRMEDKIKYILPDPPKHRELVCNYDKPRHKQRWRRQDEIDEWSWDSVRRRAVEDFNMDGRWFDDDDNLTPKMVAYRDREWDRRANGFWFYNNGRLTYITGKHYLSLQWSPMTGGGYPDFRERDMLWWYAWQGGLEDPFCYGMVYLKHRRDGFSNRAIVDSLDAATSQIAARCVITSSLDKDHAVEMIWKPILLPLLDAWPPFFIPESTSNEKPLGGVIDFDEPPRRGSSKLKNRRKGLGSRIGVSGATRKQSKADGGKIVRYFQDEPGKDKNHDIKKGWGTVKPALTQGGLIGRGLFGSTVEETEGSLSLQFASLVRESMPSEVKDDGFTESGLWFLFFPCDFCMDEDYVDEFGMSITFSPSQEQVEYQKRRQMPRILAQVGGNKRKAEESWEKIKAQKYGKGGSYQWVLNYRAAASTETERADRKRRFPLEPEDALLPSAKAAFFDQEILTDALKNMMMPGPDGFPQHESFLRHGNFEWEEYFTPTEGEGRNYTVHAVKGNVKWVDYPKGHDRCRFTVQKKMLLTDTYCPYQPNMVNRTPARHGGEKYGLISVPDILNGRPMMNKHIFKIGCDPFEWDKRKTAEREADLSKGAAWCKWVEDPVVDGDIKADSDEERHGKQRSNSYVWMYFARPTKASEFFEDMLKAAIYYGTRINVERDRSTAFQKYFEDNGCLQMLMEDQVSVINDSQASYHEPKKGTRANHDIGFMMLSEYVKGHMMHMHKFPFVNGVKQLLTVTLENIGQRDLVAAMEMTEMCRVSVRRSAGAVASLGGNSQLARNKPRASKGTMRTYKMS